jgi:hypothetical protein
MVATVAEEEDGNSRKYNIALESRDAPLRLFYCPNSKGSIFVEKSNTDNDAQKYFQKQFISCYFFIYADKL